MKKIMKKAMNICAISALAISLMTGCGNTDKDVQQSAKTESGNEKETLTIGFSFRAQDETLTQWWERTVELIDEYNADESNPYHIEYLFANADQDVDTQISDVDSLIVRQPDVICIQACDTEGSVPAFEACTQAGIPVIDYGYDSAYEDYTAKLITIDHYGAGVMQAEYLEKYLEEHPDETLKICHINGVQGISQMEDRYQGFCTIFDSEYKDRVELLDTRYCNFSADESMRTMEDWIQAFPEVNCIVSVNDEMAVGALQACIAAKHEVISVGMDGTEVAQQAIKNDGFTATVFYDFETFASEGLKLAVAVGSGGDFERDTDVSGQAMQIVDSSNIDEFLK